MAPRTHSLPSRRRFLAAAAAGLALVALVALGCDGIQKRPGVLDALVPKPPTELTVVSYNIRYGTASDGPNNWDARRGILLASIRRLDPDILCLQEALDFQVAYLTRELGMSYVGVGRDDGKLAGEFSAILYRADRLTAEANKTFWLSDSPQRPGSVSWGNKIPRICTFATFVQPETGRRLKVFNTHLDHESEMSRNRSAELISQAMLSSRQLGVPVLLAGDFNATPDSATLRYLRGEMPSASGRDGVTASPKLIDTLASAPGGLPVASQAGTFHQFSLRTDGPRIDYILIEKPITAVSAGIDHFDQSGLPPSDHFAVFAKIKLP